MSTLKTRRHFVQTASAWPALIACPAVIPALVQAQTFQATPRQTEGPYYPDQALADADADLLQNGTVAYAAGQPVWVGGVVTDLQGKPVSGAVVEIWQCDHEGIYKHSQSSGSKPMAFQGFGKVQVSADGSYRFRTIKPVPYPGRPPHIHFKVKLGKRELLTTQMYVKGESGNGRDFLVRSLNSEQRSSLEASFVQTADGLIAQFPIRLAI